MAETTSRILGLLNLLQTHRQWPGPQLAERLGVTERTLRRDIDRLRELGYRVEATRGAAGGYRLEAGSQLPPLLLTDDEAVTMAIGLRVAATQGLVDGEQTTLSALAKFEQVLPSALRQRVNAVAGFVLPQTPRSTPVSQELLGQLALACRDRERIRFDYVAGDGAETKRVVEPHTLVASERRWFFVCWDLQRADWRTFRIDRMSGFFPTGLHFEPRELPAADAAEFVSVALAALRRRHAGEVVLSMPIDRMREYFGPWARDAVAVDENTTSWPIGGDSAQAMLSALAWVPEGVEYELRGTPEFLAFAREAAARMQRASGLAREARSRSPRSRSRRPTPPPP
jgi:predicted DNA-binding transcriptional regulator YafY